MVEDVVLTVPNRIVIPAETQLILLGTLLGAAIFYCGLLYVVFRIQEPEDSRFESMFWAFLALSAPHKVVPMMIEDMAEVEETSEDLAEKEGGSDG